MRNWAGTWVADLLAVAEAVGAMSFHSIGSTYEAPTAIEGSGTAIGQPIIDLQVEPQDWEVFRHVDRHRGDSLLGIVWMPDPPEGWA